MPYFGSLIVLGQQAILLMFGLMSKLTGTRVPTIDGICHHFTILLVPIDFKS